MLLVLLLLVASPVYAFWCNGWFPSIGEHKVKILNKCGQPISKEIVATKWSSRDEKAILVEEWTYKKDVYYVLTFEGSRLVKIDWYR